MIQILLMLMGFEHVQDDFQHDFTQMTDEAYGSVILPEVALSRECNNSD